MNILSGTMMQSGDDYINATTVFGDVKRVVLSKEFKGGSIRNLFGNTDIDFTQADMTSTAVLDISQAFGQVTIAIPQGWMVDLTIANILAQVDDDRSYLERTKKYNKTLVISGISLLAAVDIVYELDKD
jgi:predicted membrane protein